MSNIFEKIGHFFTDLFNAAEKAWHKLEPEVQNALLHGSGVISVINENLDKAPDFVFELIQKKFPDLTEEKLKSGLNQVAQSFNIAEQTADADLLTTIKNLQAFLSTLKGNFWQGISSALAQLLSIALAPDQTPFAKVSTLVEYAYTQIIKGGDRPPKPPKNP